LPGTPFVTLTTLDRPFDETATSKDPGAPLVTGTTGVFDVLGVDILSGRRFDALEVAEGHNVVVLSAKTASQVFGTTDVTGREVLVRLAAFYVPPAAPRVWRATVVGVAADTDSQRLSARSTGVVYAPLRPNDVKVPFLVLAVRSSLDPAATARTLPAIMRLANPEIPMPASGPARLIITPEIVLYRYVAVVCAVLAGLGLAMSMTGLYGVLSLLVSRRTREFGLRMALGGTARRIAWMVLKDGARPVRDGLLIGLLFGVGGRALFRYATGRQDIALFDAVGFAVVAVVLSIAAAVACYLPARRASRVDPNVALREL
jgi:putative ABC transport system permease protein